MKKLSILGVAIILLGLICGALLWVHFRALRPEALLARLAQGKGDRETLTMQLNVARGDVISSMIVALHNEDYPASFRADILEMLFKQNFRSAEPRIEEAIRKTVEDSELVIRRKAAYGLAMYAEPRLQLALLDCLDDPDPEVRRQAYLVLGISDWSTPIESGIWSLATTEQKEKMLRTCVEQAKKEEDVELRFLVRAVIGKEIAIRSNKAREALQRSDLSGAKELFEGNLDLDPENKRAQISLIRFYFNNGDQDKALELAKEYGALISVPQLSEAPIIDGDPNDSAWAEAFTTDTFYHSTSRWVERHTEGKSKACIGYRDGTLYIAVLGYEEDLGKLLVKSIGRDSPAWRDDCVEMVFDPGNTEREYYQFVVNAAGALYDRFCNDAGKNFKCQQSARIFNDRGYWAVEFAISGEDMGNHPIKPGAIWTLNVFRVRVGPASEHCTIWPSFGGSHEIYFFPLVLFE